ncbi:Peroxiredoxin [Dyadobacter soli]|uniref:Peroxiredoxin n=1 Tax=Dyadobacter soli TaxID=659014 RepID=A0A1G6VSI2_9BACT|nr:TlpA disulfide reductase family protein [Dyadobacter soli]SDD56509.1 Peroxiredoxin [Dyadobacter soli]
MKVFVSFLLMFTVSIVCAQNTDKTTDKLVLEGTITVHIKYVTQSENVLVKLGTYHSFPRNDVSLVPDTLTRAHDEIYLTSPCRNLGLSFLHIADSTYRVVGAPGDTIDVSILADVSKATSQSLVSFEGENKEIQQYYQLKTRRFGDPIQECMNAGMSAVDLVPFQAKMDESYAAQYELWKEFQNAHKLPDWFITYETNALNYTDAWLRIYMVWYQTMYQKKNQVIPESYYAFKNRVKVKNETIMYQYEYLRFLREQLFWQMRQSDRSLGLKNPADYAKEELGENMGSFFEIWELSGSVDNPNSVETEFSKHFPANYQYLVDFIKHRAKATKRLLKAGNKAPNFALVDLNDSLVTLNQYRGQVVYLSFWFTTCGPCIQEIPYENKLVEHFKGKPVKIISICTGTPGAADDQQIAKWRATSERFGLKTIDLFANRSWATTLAKNYMVSVYPHYVLIGADGNIIENFADRPSQGVASKIEKALTETSKH